MVRKASKTEILRGTAVDQLPCERFFVSGEERTAADAEITVIHGKEPGNTGTVSYRAPGQPD